jgi:acyl dehydratase
VTGWQPPALGSRATWTRTFTADDVEAFARISGDRNPLHFDAEFVSRTRVGRLVVQGGLTSGLFNALVAMKLPDPARSFSTRSGTTRLPSTSAMR